MADVSIVQIGGRRRSMVLAEVRPCAGRSL